MKQVCLLALSMLLACSGGEGTPAAKVGSTEHDRQTDPMVEENKRIALREELDIDGWEKRQDLVLERTGTGVRMKLIRDSVGVSAKPGQLARIRFSVSLISGRQCYASSLGETEEFKIEEDNVESGLHEAIQRMSVGDSAVIVLPSHRAYGLLGDKSKIPMRSTVIYRVGLVGVR
ncbi:MAG: FKBP-type peptidyl-prolyl cis-trans isomerase [Flavobacteriales bacterium]|nr:FKBP-type peptidyl-prolyl cis-trans isomerase [Flavobacteriales bacterium]